jgi:hypothetical protein
MGKVWYESGTPPSTAASPLMRERRSIALSSRPPSLAFRPAGVTLALAFGLAAGCTTVETTPGAGASSPGEAPSRGRGAVASVAPVSGPAGAEHANLAGAHCKGATCACHDRRGGATAVEVPPPDEGHKRFQIRLAAEDGAAVLESPTLGRFTSTGPEVCYTIDVVPGTTHDVSFLASEGRAEGGVGPVLGIEEYGPKGPFWYDILEVRCGGPAGKCNRDAADEWGADIKKRKRGRIDPCGSTVITHLTWDTSGGSGARELGLFKDFSVKFTMEVKKFATQFAPGSKECVPK